MRQWKLHHGLPSFTGNVSFASRNTSGRHLSLFAPSLDSGTSLDHSTLIADDGDGDHWQLPEYAPETATSRRGVWDPESTIGDDVAGDTTLSLLLPTVRFYGCSDIALAPLTTDVNQCKPGDIVVYSIGEDDPVELIAKALAAGASAIVTEQLLPCPLPQAIVGDAAAAAATIRHHQLGRPDDRQLTIAVVGSAGKTTTALFIAAITKQMGLATAYQTSLGNHDGQSTCVPETSVPGGSELIEFLNTAAENAASVSVIEVNSLAATHGRYDCVSWDIAVCVGPVVGSDHFGPLPIDAVLQNLAADGVVVLPASDTATVDAMIAAEVEVVTYGGADADVTHDIIDNTAGMMTLLLSVRDSMHVLETPITGVKNADNLAAAACVGLLFDRPVHQIADAIASVRRLPGRDQRFTAINKPAVVLDSARTPANVAEALRNGRAAAVTSGGKLWVVMAIQEDDLALPQIGTKLEKYAHQVIVTSAGEKESFLRSAHQVIDGVKECMHCRLICDPSESIRFAVDNATSRDVIVVLCGDRASTPAVRRRDLQTWQTRIESSIEGKAAAGEVAVGLKVFRGEG